MYDTCLILGPMNLVELSFLPRTRHSRYTRFSCKLYISDISSNKIWLVQTRSNRGIRSYAWGSTSVYFPLTTSKWDLRCGIPLASEVWRYPSKNSEMYCYVCFNGPRRWRSRLNVRLACGRLGVRTPCSRNEPKSYINRYSDSSTSKCSTADVSAMGPRRWPL